MAIKSAKAAKKGGAAPSAVASLRPDNMSSAGLADDFNGLVTKARLVPWNYGGSIDHYILAVAVTIKPDEDSGFDEFTQYYSAGELDFFAPSMDGENPVDIDSWSGNDEDIEEVEGVYALKVGQRAQLNNNSNYAHLLGALVDAGVDQDTMTTDIRWMEGIYGHWNRVPQKKRSGIQVQPAADGKEQRERTLLVLTELLEAPTEKASAKAGKKTTTAAKPAAAKKGAAAKAETNGGGDIDSKLEEAIVAALSELEEGESLTRKQVNQIALKNFTGKEKALAVSRAGEEDFYENAEQLVYDDEDGSVSLVSE